MKRHLKSLLAASLAFCILMLITGCITEVDNGGGSSYPTITYVDENGNTLSTQTTYGGTVYFDYEKTGYKNTFFDENGNQVESGWFSTDENCKIIVKSEPISYTVKFQVSSYSYGTTKGTLPEAISCTYDAEFTLPENNLSYTYSSTTYRASGWSKDGYDSTSKKGEYSSGQKVKNLSSTDGATVILYACFTKGGSIELKFYKDDSSYSYSYNTVYAESGEILGKNSVPDPTGKKGHTFEGYYLSTDSAQTIVDFDTYQVTGNATFKPKFSIATYTATFITTHGTAPESVSWTYSTSSYSATKISLTEGYYVLTAIGYKFEGWCEPGSTYTKSSINAYYDDKNLTLTAKWTPWTATLTYDKNAPSGVSVSGNMTSYSYTLKYDTAQNLKKSDLYASGYEFIGWNTKKDGSGTSYADEASYIWKGADKETITLYAQWKKLQTQISIAVTAPSTGDDITLMYNSTSTRFEANFPGASSFKWYVDGTLISSETGPALSGYVLSEGQHSVMVTVDFVGRTYGSSLLANVTVSEAE